MTVEDAIARYVPYGIADAAVREAVTGFARGVVADVRPDTAERARRLLTAIAGLGRWAVSAGYELDRDVLLRADVIDHYVRTGLGSRSKKTVGTVRSWLFEVSAALLAAPDDLEPIRPVGAGSPMQPYTAEQVTALRFWARNQRTESRTRNATALLALGCGAGLTTCEICGVRSEHVRVDSGGVLIDVRAGGHSRVVPVLGPWEADLAAIVNASPRADAFVFRPGRRVEFSKNAVSDFVADLPDKPAPLVVTRMRATWLVGHLTAGTPVKVLLEAAGLVSAEALESYLPYVPRIEDQAARAWLRGVPTAGNGDGEKR